MSMFDDQSHEDSLQIRIERAVGEFVTFQAGSEVTMQNIIKTHPVSTCLSAFGLMDLSPNDELSLLGFGARVRDREYDHVGCCRFCARMIQLAESLLSGPPTPETPVLTHFLNFARFTTGVSFGREDDYESAAHWFELLPESYVGRNFALGSTYHSLRDFDRAIHFYERACNDPQVITALYNLGCLYDDGIDGVGRDFKKAEETFLRVLELNPRHTAAMCNLANLYEQHPEVLACPGDQSHLVYKYYKEATDLGDMTACYSLVLLFENGSLLDVDPIRSREFLEFYFLRSSPSRLLESAHALEFGLQDYPLDFEKARDCLVHLLKSLRESNPDELPIRKKEKILSEATIHLSRVEKKIRISRFRVTVLNDRRFCDIEILFCAA